MMPRRRLLPPGPTQHPLLCEGDDAGTPPSLDGEDERDDALLRGMGDTGEQPRRRLSAAALPARHHLLAAPLTRHTGRTRQSSARDSFRSTLLRRAEPQRRRERSFFGRRLPPAPPLSSHAEK
jgi:hypothetical protein